LISPSGTISTSTPAYTWNATSDSARYYLWVNDSATNGKIKQWYAAEQAGCPSGTGTCSVTPTTSLATGPGRWWIQAWNEAGYGPWSDLMTFVVVSPWSGNIPGSADLALAGQPDGMLLQTGCSRDSSPLNSPVLVPSAVIPGQVLQISATGLVDVNGSHNPQTPPDGDVSSSTSTARAFGISSIKGLYGALIGVFLGPDTPNPSSTPSDVDFTGAARELVTLRPLLQQPFYIGRGKTSTGTIKNFVVPQGATRLFLGILDYPSCNSDNTGSFTVTVQ
jgi:hypothetical protein